MKKTGRQGLRVTIIGLNYFPEVTGIAPYTTRLAETLVANGMRVHVCTGYPHYPEWRLRNGYSGWKLVEDIRGVKVTRYRHFIPRRSSTLGRVLLEASFGLRVSLARWPVADVVLVVTPALLSSVPVIIRLRASRSKIPLAVWVQDLYTRGLEEVRGESASTIRAMRQVESFVLRSAAGVSVIHERFKDFVVQHLQVNASSVEVIRNWTHTRSRSTLDKSSIRRRLGWRDDEVVTLHAGNMGEKQALENVVEAATIARDRGLALRFVLLGDGNQRSKIAQMAEGVDTIEIIDPLPDDEFDEVLRSADILLVNEKRGLKETAVPSKLTTYFAAGLPVVAATEADSTTATEIALSGAGLRIDPEDGQKLVDAITHLGVDSAARDALGEAGLLYSQVALSEDAAISAYTEWLTRVAATRSTVPAPHESLPATAPDQDHEKQGDLR